MSTPILSTKLFIPPPRPNVVHRPRLTARLDAGLRRTPGATVISAPAGFGKTTLVSEWVAALSAASATAAATDEQAESVKVAWLSLDEGDSDPARFLTCLVAALQTVAATIGAGVLRVLQTPQLPPIEPTLTALLNEIAAITDKLILILDDYHVIEAKPVDHALSFLLAHLPPQMHLVIATREDPNLPLARLRAQGQLTELRAADLRFTPAEAAEFLNRVMALSLSPDDIAALETRTEGWIAGLQLAAISMQGHPDAAGFIHSFTGSHRFVMDYLVEEVLHRQPASIQTFLLRTSILERLCGPLCDAVLGKDEGGRHALSAKRSFAVEGMKDEISDPSFIPSSSSVILESLEHANLFLIPLDGERRWYRYHHLFADLLRRRLSQTTAATGDGHTSLPALHTRASIWYEQHGLEREAFQHAVAARDVDRAAALVEGNGMPLLFRGVFIPVLNWFESLPHDTLDRRPGLWVIYASALLIMGHLNQVELKLQAAEAALQTAAPDEITNDLIGHIAAIRANAAVAQNRVDVIIAQSRRALDYLHPGNVPVRTSCVFALGYAYQLQGNRAAARQAYTETLATSQKIGHNVTAVLATGGLGNLHEADNQLHRAAETYRHVLEILGEPTLPVGCEAHLGLARIFYQWNDLEAAAHHAQHGARLARQIENSDRFVVDELWLARITLAQGDAASAAAHLAQARQTDSPQSVWLNSSEAITAQTLILIRLGRLAEALHLAQTHSLPLYEAQVHLAQGDAPAALEALEAAQQQAQARGWADEMLNGMVVQAAALHMHGENTQALQRLDEALALAEPEGFVRLFVDKGLPMAQLLSEAAAQGMRPDYVARLLAAIDIEAHYGAGKAAQPLVEPLSLRELEVLRLIAQGLSNREISQRLFLALDTVKGHNRRVFEKLQVQRRTEAVARARQLGLL